MDHIIDRLGGTNSVARMCGVKPPSVTEWRRNGVPGTRRIQLERATEGRFKAEDFGLDVRFIRIPDPSWPWHPSGRPVVDDQPPQQLAMSANACLSDALEEARDAA